MNRKHSHYFKDVSNLDTVDVYRLLALFGVTDQCIGHAIKKLLVAGGRGGGKDISKDISEAIDTLQRWQEMRTEDAPKAVLPRLKQVLDTLLCKRNGQPCTIPEVCGQQAHCAKPQG